MNVSIGAPSFYNHLKKTFIRNVRENIVPRIQLEFLYHFFELVI